MIDVAQAERFVELLTGASTTPVVIQIFDDSKPRSDKRLTAVLVGTIKQHATRMSRANDNGCGVFIQVNEGLKRGIKGVSAPRALFADDDNLSEAFRLLRGESPCSRCGAFHSSELPPLITLPPTIVVQSSASERNKHFYWRLAPGANLTLWSETQAQIACSLKTDSLINVDRVMRLPGTMNRKVDPEKGRDGTPFLVRLVEGHAHSYELREVRDAFPDPAAKAADIVVDFNMGTMTDADGMPIAAPGDLPPSLGADDTPTEKATRMAERVRMWLNRMQVDYDRKKQRKSPLQFILRRCVFNPTHQNVMAIMVVPASGALWAGCYHDSCGHNIQRWNDVVTKIGGWGQVDQDAFKFGSQVEIAVRLLRDLAVGSTENIVHAEGAFRRYSPLSGVWGVVDEATASRVIQSYDGRRIGENGKRLVVDRRHVSGGLSLAMHRAARSDFFDDRAPGIAFTNGFVRADMDGITLEPFSAEHRAQASLAFPYEAEAEAPRFATFLAEVFQPDEDASLKRQLLQEFAGAALLGLATRFERALFMPGRGANGKALALDTPIPTPTGWTTQGALRVGDSVLDDRGRPCHVVGVSATWNTRPCYRITFSDETTVVADAAHEWPVSRWYGKPLRRIHEIQTTENMLHVGLTRAGGDEYRWSVPMAAALALPDAALPVDPYILGAWLGNGTVGNAECTFNVDDVSYFRAKIAEAGYYTLSETDQPGAWNVRISTRPDNGAGIGQDSLQARLRKLGVLLDKHIPKQYLRASFRQRLALLHGLMDTDGSVLKTQAQCEFTSMTRQLAVDTAELVRTFGLHPTNNEYRAMLEGRDMGPKWRVIFTTVDDLNVFGLPRKLMWQRPRKQRLAHTIVACEHVDPVPVRCIEVDSPSHLYLCTEAMIPTHNSSYLRIVKAMFPHGTVASVRPQDFENEYYRARLAGDLERGLPPTRLNIVAEAPSAEIISSDSFKAIVSGDTISARRPAGNPFDFTPVAANWFALQDLPPPRDMSHGFWRKVCVLAFNRIFAAEEQDRYLADYIVENELAGVATWAVNGARRLLKRGDYSKVASSEAVKQTWQQEADVILLFVGDCCQAPSGDLPALDEETEIDDLYAHFKAWCRHTGHTRIASKHTFAKQLNQRGFGMRQSNGKRLYPLYVYAPAPTSAYD